VARRWREDEWLALIELYDRFEGAVPTWAFEELSKRLRAEAPEAARDESYRSAGGVAQQFRWIRLLASQDPRAPTAPAAARHAYYRRHTPDVEWETGLDAEHEIRATGGFAADRQAVIRALMILERTLAELVASPGLLPDELRGFYRDALGRPRGASGAQAGDGCAAGPSSGRPFGRTRTCRPTARSEDAEHRGS
jgi:hypothetical protein